MTEESHEGGTAVAQTVSGVLSAGERRQLRPIIARVSAELSEGD
jgi:hypothetical protein